MFILLGAALTAFIITFLAIPSVIRVAEIKHLFDAPDLPGGRKNHKSSIPTLGGLGIFAGLILSVTFWAQQQQIIELQYIITVLTLMFFIGMKDDIVNMVAYKKLIAQIIAALILIHFANIRINTFYGLFGLDVIPLWTTYAITLLAIVGITNSFNLIDGVDGLAAVTGLIVTVTFGSWFFLMGQLQYAILCSAVAGSLLAFLWFNRTPARIFMGDTGSLIIGIISALLTVKFVETVRQLPLDHVYKIRSAPIFALGVICIPLVDTVRVFIIRIAAGKNPLSPDRNHLHHRLVDSGFSHMQTTTILACLNLLAILAAYLVQGYHPEVMLFAIPLGLLLSIEALIHLKRRSFPAPSHSRV